MNIICVMAIYKRQAVTLETIRWLKKQTLPISKIIVIGSTPRDRKTAKLSGVFYIESDNLPLSNKWQKGIEEARKYNPDAILICGSDSWLSPKWCEVGSKYIKNGYDLVGKYSSYTCEINPGKQINISHISYKKRKDPFGAGRLFSKKILDSINWKLYPLGYNVSLDGHSYKAISLSKLKPKIAIMNSESNISVLDVKSNLWATINSYDNLIKYDKMFNINNNKKNHCKWLNNNFSGWLESLLRVIPDAIPDWLSEEEEYKLLYPKLSNLPTCSIQYPINGGLSFLPDLRCISLLKSLKHTLHVLVPTVFKPTKGISPYVTLHYASNYKYVFTLLHNKLHEKSNPSLSDKVHESAMIHPNVTIGEDGLDCVFTSDGKIKQKHIGNIIIEEEVQILSNTSIYRPVFGSTVIQKNTLVGSLCGIGGNTKIGSSCVISTGTIIGNNCNIGHNCFIGLGSIIQDGISICDSSVVCDGSLVTKNINNPISV